MSTKKKFSANKKELTFGQMAMISLISAGIVFGLKWADNFVDAVSRGEFGKNKISTELYNQKVSEYNDDGTIITFDAAKKTSDTVYVTSLQRQIDFDKDPAAYKSQGGIKRDTTNRAVR